MFAIDKYAYQNRLKNLPVAYKFVIYLLLLAVSFSGVRILQLGLIVLMAPLTCYVALSEVVSACQYLYPD